METFIQPCRVCGLMIDTQSEGRVCDTCRAFIEDSHDRDCDLPAWPGGNGYGLDY